MGEPLSDVERESRELFQRLNLITAGERSEVAWRAAQDLFTAIISVTADTPEQAIERVDAACRDLRASVIKNWRWYREQINRSEPKQGHAITTAGRKALEGTK